MCVFLPQQFASHYQVLRRSKNTKGGWTSRSSWGTLKRPYRRAQFLPAWERYGTSQRIVVGSQAMAFATISTNSHKKNNNVAIVLSTGGAGHGVLDQELLGQVVNGECITANIREEQGPIEGGWSFVI
jgi:hypothetical protein